MVARVRSETYAEIMEQPKKRSTRTKA